jgi:ferredoxin
VARILFVSARIRLEMGAGERLLDALDAGERPVLPLACRAMNCGICRVRLVSGGGAMRPATPREQRLLQQLGAAADERLGCQLVLETDSADTEVLLEPRPPR